jgi:hypothetical protein
MSRTAPAFGRRQFLRGSGAVVALPFLESLAAPAVARAAASAGPPVRMAIFSYGQGTVRESWVPAATGRLETLPSILRSLEPFKDDMLLVSGLAHHGGNENLNAHEHCALLHLTGARKVGRAAGKLFTQVSVDQVLAEHFAGRTLFPSLELGAAAEGAHSFNRRGLVVPGEGNPQRLFNRMFRPGRPIVAPNWQARAGWRDTAVDRAASGSAEDFSVLDVVSADAKAVARRLGREDREKLADYLESIRALENRLERTEQRIAMELADKEHPGPGRPVLTEEPKHDLDRFRKATQGHPVFYEEYVELMSDLLILAFQTDTTRVATFAAGGPGMYHGVVTVGTERHGHTLDHNGGFASPEQAEPIAREACRQKHEWMTRIFSKTVTKMKAIDEGGSTLLDNSRVLYTSYMADGGHGRNEIPALLLGKAGGRLRTGQHLRVEPGTPVANLYCEMLNIMGVPTKEFGENLTAKTVRYDGRLPGLV